MIGALYPFSLTFNTQRHPKAFRSGGGSLLRTSDGLHATAQRYLEEELDISAHARPTTEDLEDGTVPWSTPASPNKHQKDGGIAVAVVSSVDDVQESDVLRLAQSGDICVVVISRQTSKHELSKAGNTPEDETSKPGRDSVAVLSTCTGERKKAGPVGALARYLRRFIFQRRRMRSPALLVLCCRLRGVVMSFPLRCRSFRLRRMGHDWRPDVGGTNKMCWILPDKGFNALCTMETSIVPGLPSLVRDMARDLNCLESDGEPLSSGARAPLDVSVSDEEHKSYQFLSRVAGIVFILYSGSKRKSSGAPVPLRNLGKVVAPPSADDVAVRGATTTAVVARLVSDTGSSGTKCVFTLDRYGGNWREAAAAADCVQGGRESLSSIGVNRSDKERPKGRTHISLPVTYAQLLAEVASQPPEPHLQTIPRLWRWRWQRKHCVKENRVVPGGGMEDHEKKYQRYSAAQPADNDVHEGEGPWSGTKSAIDGGCIGRVEEEDTLREGQHILTPCAVRASSPEQAALWASTQAVVRKLFALACQPNVNEDGTFAAESEGANIPMSSRCSNARSAALALLERVFEGVQGQSEIACCVGDGRLILSRTERARLFDVWYETFLVDVAGGDCRGLLLERPRSLLETILEVPDLKVGFLERGLLGRLAQGLRKDFAASPRRRFEHQRFRVRRGYIPASAVAHPRRSESARTVHEAAGDSKPLLSHATTSQKSRRLHMEAQSMYIQFADMLPSEERDLREDGVRWWRSFGSGGRGENGIPSGWGDITPRGTDEGSADDDGYTGGRTELPGSCRTLVDGGLSQCQAGWAPHDRLNDDRESKNWTEGDPTPTARNCVVLDALRTARLRQGKGEDRRLVGDDDCEEMKGAGNAGVRVAPPMLRLDALSRRASTSPASCCSPHATVALSAASTRAPAHLLFMQRSARGSTSRASARHNSGRSSVRITHRDSGSAGYPTGRSGSSAGTNTEEITPPRPVSHLPSGASDCALEMSTEEASPQVVCLSGRRSRSNDVPDSYSSHRTGKIWIGEGKTSVAQAVCARSAVYDASTDEKQPEGKASEVKDLFGAVSEAGDSDVGDDDRVRGVDPDASNRAALSLSGKVGADKSVRRKEVPSLKLSGLPVNQHGDAAGLDADPSLHLTTDNPHETLPSYGKQRSQAKHGRRDEDNVPHQRSQDSPVNASALGSDFGIQGGVCCRRPSLSQRGTRSDPTSKVCGNSSTGTVLSLFCASSPSAASLESGTSATSSSPRVEAPSGCSSGSKNSLSAHIELAMFVLSLMASTALMPTVKGDAEEALSAALNVLSITGAMAWADTATSSTAPDPATALAVTVASGEGDFEESHATNAFKSVPSIGDPSPEIEMKEPSLTAVWPSHLKGIDMTLLLSSVSAQLDDRMQHVRQHIEAVCGENASVGSTSSTHREWVHAAGQLGVECAWLSRLLLVQLLDTDTQDPRVSQSSLLSCSKDMIRIIMECCGHGLESILRCLRFVSIGNHPPGDKEQQPLKVLASACFAEGTINESHNRTCEGKNTNCSGIEKHGERLKLSDFGAEMSILMAPVVIDLAEAVTLLLETSRAWGDGLAWAEAVRDSTALRSDSRGGVAHVGAPLLGLIEILDRLTSSRSKARTIGLSGPEVEKIEWEEGSVMPAPLSLGVRAMTSTASPVTTMRSVEATACDDIQSAVLQSLSFVVRVSKITLKEVQGSIARKRQFMRGSEAAELPSAVKDLGRAESARTSARTTLSEGVRRTSTEGETSGIRNVCHPPSPEVEQVFTPKALRGQNQGTPVAPVELRQEQEKHEIIESTCYHLLANIKPLFRTGGPILAIIESHLSSTKQWEHHQKQFSAAGDAPVTKAMWRTARSENLLEVPCAGPPTMCLGAVLRLIAAFMSMWGQEKVNRAEIIADRVNGDTAYEIDVGDEGEVVRRGDYVFPLFRGFVSRWQGLVGAGVDSTMIPHAGSMRKVGHEFSIRQACRLHLEALVQLAKSGDQAVVQRLHECRAAQFLLHAFFLNPAEGDRQEAFMIHQRRDACREDDGESQKDDEKSTSLIDGEGAAGVPSCNAPHHLGRGRRLGHAGGKRELNVGRFHAGRLDGYALHGDPRLTVVNDPSTVGAQLGGVCERVLGCGTLKEAGQNESSHHSPGPVSSHVSPGCTRAIHRGSKTATGSHTSTGSDSGCSDVFEQVVQHEARTKVSRSLVVGDRIYGLVAVRKGHSRWFPGRVEELHADGTLHVVYDDGDEECRKSVVEVRLASRRPALGINMNTDSGSGVPRAAARTRCSSDVQNEAPSKEPATALTGASGRTHQRADGGLASTIAEGTVVVAAVDINTIEAGSTAVTACSPEMDSTASTGSQKLAAEDGEDDDMCYTIPTVLNPESTPESSGRSKIAPAPASPIPRIDLQSFEFRSRVRSSQLGPGSSLSTPTTGGGGGSDVRRMKGTSRSEASLATVLHDEKHALGPRRQSRRGTPSSSDRALTLEPSRGLLLTSARGFPASRSASFLPVVSRLTPAPVGGPESLGTRPSSNDTESFAYGKYMEGREHEEGPEQRPWEEPEVNADAARSSASYADSKATAHVVPDRPAPVRHGAPECIDSPAQHASSSVGRKPDVGESVEETAAGARGDGGKGRPINGSNRSSNERGDICQSFSVGPVIENTNKLPHETILREDATSILLSVMASTILDYGKSAFLSKLGCPSTPLICSQAPSPARACGGRAVQARDFACEIMEPLQEWFDDRLETDFLPFVSARWSGFGVSQMEMISAVVSKLICPGLFDASSYALGGRYIAAGRSGGIITSGSALPLGGRRWHSSVAQLASHEADAHGQRSSDEVALKIVERDRFDCNVVFDMASEVVVLASLSGVEGVCRLYDFGVTPTSYVLVMERCALSLTEWRLARTYRHSGNGGIEVQGGGTNVGGLATLSNAPRSDMEVVLYLLVFRQICSAVAAMAERGIIHLDLKCDNILVRNEHHEKSSMLVRKYYASDKCTGTEIVPSVCVADFGESVIRRRKEHLKPGKTKKKVGSDAVRPVRDGARGDSAGADGFFDVRIPCARGTERIQSPEMILLAGATGEERMDSVRDSKTTTSKNVASPRRHPEEKITRKSTSISCASDVWSLGCLLYEILSGSTLFGALHWSEFFVLLTAGMKAAGSGTGIMPEASPVNAPAGHAATDPCLVPPLPPVQSLIPFAPLPSAEVLKRLLTFLLVRDPVKRPTARHMVCRVDEALEEVLAVDTSSIEQGSSRARTSGPGVHQSCVDEIVWTHTHRIERSGLTKPSTSTSGSDQNHQDQQQQWQQQQQPTGCRREKQHFRHRDVVPDTEGSESRDESASTSPARGAGNRKHAIIGEETRWPLRPCAAVIAHRKLATSRCAVFGCAGCLYRLRSGAFLLALSDDEVVGEHKFRPEGNGGSVSCRTEASHLDQDADDIGKGAAPEAAGREMSGSMSFHRARCTYAGTNADPRLSLGPDTMVYCCFDNNDRCTAGGVMEISETGDDFIVPLKKILPALGVTHVVCVTPVEHGRKGRLGGDERSSTPAQSTIGQQAPPGWQVLSVDLSISDTSDSGVVKNEHGNGCIPQAKISGQTQQGVVGDVLAFAVGPRALFVGDDGDRGAAGALAMAWAMNRTGKGCFETMLEFRQSFVGFWADSSTIRSVLGRT